MEVGSQRLITLADRLRHAASQGHLDEVTECLQSGASFEPDQDGRTALHYAALNGYTEVAKFLLEKGCGINIQDASGYTALHRAASQGHVDMIVALLEKGCDVNTQDEHGNAAIHEAAWNGFSKTLELLVKYNVNVSIVNKAGFTALHLSAQNGHNESSRVLLYAGCNSDIKNNYGDTTLHTAARYGHAGVTRILISARAKLNEQNKNGDTALHIAAALKRRKIAKLLVDSGIDVTVRNKQNETAIDVARRKDHGEIIVIIQAYSKPVKPPAREVNFKMDPHYMEGPVVVPDMDIPEKPNGPTKEEKGKRFLFFKKKKPKEKEKASVPRSMFPQRRAPAEPVQGFFSKYVPKEGVQYYRDLAGNIKQGPVGYSPTCNCLPAIHQLQKQVHQTHDHVYGHIQSTSRVMQEQINQVDHRSNMRVQALEKYTQDRFNEEENLCRQRINQRFEEHNNYNVTQGDHVKTQIQNWLEQKLEGYGHCLHHHHDDSALPNENIFSDVHETANGRLFKSRSDETLSQSDNHSGRYRKRDFYESRQEAMQQIRAWQVPSYSKDRNRVKVIDRQGGNTNEPKRSQSRQQIDTDFEQSQRYPVEPRIEIRNQPRSATAERLNSNQSRSQNAERVNSKTNNDYMDMTMSANQNQGAAARQVSMPQPQVYPNTPKKVSGTRKPITHSTPKSKESSPYAAYSGVVRSQTDSGVVRSQTDSGLNHCMTVNNSLQQTFDKTKDTDFELKSRLSFSERNITGRSQSYQNQTQSSENSAKPNTTSANLMSPTFRNSTSSDHFSSEVPKPTFSTFGYDQMDSDRNVSKHNPDPTCEDNPGHNEVLSSSTPRSNQSGHSDHVELASKTPFSLGTVSRQNSHVSYGFTPRNQDDMYVEMKNLNPRLHERAKSSEGLLETDLDRINSSRSHSEERTLDSQNLTQGRSLSETRENVVTSVANSSNSKSIPWSQTRITSSQTNPSFQTVYPGPPYATPGGLNQSPRPPTLPKPSVHSSTSPYTSTREVKRGIDVRYSGDLSSIQRNPVVNNMSENPYSTVKDVRDNNHNLTVKADVHNPTDMYYHHNPVNSAANLTSNPAPLEPRSKTAYQTYLTENPHFSNENLYHRESSPNICNNSKEDSSSNPDSGYSSKIYGNRGTSATPVSSGSTPSSSFSTDRGIASNTNSPHSQYSNADYEYLPKREYTDEVQNHVQTWYQRKLQETTQKVYDSWRSERSPGKLGPQPKQNGGHGLPLRNYGNSDYAKIDYTPKSSRQQNGGQSNFSYTQSVQPNHIVSTFVVHGSDV